ncbi:MAG: aminodeoxychorismate lyase [Gammaproteobacteria bacterium]
MNLINGKPSSSISIFDRGFLYGDGVFETILVINKKLINFNLHVKRIKIGCASLKIKNLNYTALNKFITKALKDQNSCVLNITITRGTAKKRGYNLNIGKVKPNIIISTSKIPNYPKKYNKEGVSTKFSKNILENSNRFSKIKHLNRLEQVLASEELTKNNPEIILCDKDKFIVEGVASNIFFIKKNIFYTPPIENCGVEGIMRSVIISYLNKNKYNIKISKIKKNNFKNYDGAFFCNSIRLIWNIKSIENYKYKSNTHIHNLIKKINEDIHK